MTIATVKAHIADYTALEAEESALTSFATDLSAGDISLHLQPDGDEGTPQIVAPNASIKSALSDAVDDRLDTITAAKTTIEEIFSEL